MTPRTTGKPHKLNEDCIHINVCYAVGKYGSKGCVVDCPEYINIAPNPAAPDVLEELRKIFVEIANDGICYPSLSGTMNKLDHLCDNDLCGICEFDEAVLRLRQQHQRTGDDGK